MATSNCDNGGQTRQVSLMAASAAAQGFDICEPLLLQDYNASVARELRLPTHGHETGTLAVLLGNTKRLWPLVSATRPPPLQRSLPPRD